MNERLGEQMLRTWEDVEVRCGWCGLHIGGSEKGVIVSHGICQECRDKHFPDLYKPEAAA